eukprot:997153-Alexandrium_andersonii.AAC.1
METKRPKKRSEPASEAPPTRAGLPCRPGATSTKARTAGMALQPSRHGGCTAARPTALALT